MTEPEAPPVVAVVGAVPGTVADAAVAAARLGADVRLVGLAAGGAGTRDLATEGVDVSAVTTAGHLDADPVRRVLEGIEGLSAVLVGTDVSAAVVAAAVGTAAQRGVRCVLDPDPVIPTVLGLLDLGAVLTPDAAELADLVRRGASREAAGRPPHEAAATLHSWSGAPVVVTLGADGVLLADGGRVRRLPAHPATVVDPAGAKSALLGVLAALLAGGEDLEDALGVAVVAAALATTAPGPRAAMPTGEQLDAALG
ncbi:PfkB family carbohydrate kinase [Actinomycetospora termitidis]|uniref:PfkB family carbohydrate kinase n=1 Tax=Actinomycetospora termitidis TaxID=3053470 RepID=A0ABT7M7E0_9PSEU|nr:PfkB family carbohydrate kinase [Actinomycetospora sp. Odt1-22]MDL5156585.1 PfkB family carbohydrate kinase [Actinomycetospora sp. Odt1-22]